MRVYLKPLHVWKRLCHHQQINNNHTVYWKQPSGYSTDILIYNPLTKTKEPLILKNNKIAKWYMCGPTVYDTSHIGHACSYIRFDIIRRILTEFFDINVISVMGITDIDDKIIKRSQGSSRFADWKQLAKFHEQQFYADMALLNVLPPYLYCRVSDYVPQIIEFIEKIIANESAYTTGDGSVYFDTQHYSEYGKFGRNPPNELHAIKKSNLDFALWKASKEDEPFWDSPWGPGRPGWHIECSVMGSTTLGDYIDLHSGGFDLMFPHHENEEAQSCCHHECKQWVNYWLHAGLLNLEDVKMSKSLQNTISIKELLDMYTANEFRFMCLTTHYRTPIDFSHVTMQKAVALMKKIDYFHSDCMNYMTGKIPLKYVDENDIYTKLNNARQKIHVALCDDFSTPKVIFELLHLVDSVNKMLETSQENQNRTTNSVACICAVSTYVSRILSLFGITKTINSDNESRKLTEVIDNLVQFRRVVRNQALGPEIKKTELLSACDDVRKNLATCGIKVKDFKDTSTWTITEE